MADRYPLVVDATDSNKIKEIPNGDNLNLTGNNITGVVNVTATGTLTAQTLNISGSVTVDSNPLAAVALSGSFNDLVSKPTNLSDFVNDLSFLTTSANLSLFTNDIGFITGVTFAEVTSKPTTLGGYGITDAATSIQGGLASSAVQPGDNISTLLNDSGFVTLTQLTNGSVTVDVNNSGDLVGSVFADDSTVMVDSILAAVNLDGTIRGNIKPNAQQDDTWDIGSSSQQFKDLYLGGTIKFATDASPVDLPSNSTVGGIIIGSSSGSGAGYITVAADDSTQRVINRFETLKISGGTGITTTSDAEGEITIAATGSSLSTAGNTGTGTVALASETLQVLGTTNEINVEAAAFALTLSLADNVSGILSLNASTSVTGGAVVLSGSNIDTSDSSAMTITPAVTMQSDLTVQNNLTIDNDLNVSGSFNTVGSGTPEIFSDNEIELNAGTRIQATTGPFQMLAITTTQRDALTSANADIIYNSSTNVFQGRANGAWVSLTGSGGLAAVVDDTTPQLGGDLDGQGNKVLFANVYSALVDLPSASTYHGMFAHVHATGKGYFAHGGAWIPLQNESALTGDVDAHLNQSGPTDGYVLSWTSGDYAWVANSGSGLSNIVDDTTPQLGGTLDANGNTIDMGTNVLTDTNLGQFITAYGWGDHGSAGYLTSVPAQTFASLTSKPTTIAGYGITDGGIASVVADTTPQLGGDLDVNGKTIAHTFTLGADGTSHYTFSDAGNIWFPTTENDPILYLRRGEQYIFVNSSGGSHPFEIRVSNGGSAYSTGVTNNGASSGNIVFKVPMGAPATLYYQCTSHSDMGNTINIV